MDKLIIEGGCTIAGKISASGSKNATLPILFASTLGQEASTVCCAPQLVDVSTTLRLLSNMGAKVALDSDGCWHLNTHHLNHLEADYTLVKTMRASILALGPILARYGHVKISLPGGCAIGTRPVDMHLKALQSLGANIKVKSGYIYASAKQLIGNHIHFEQISVTATENLIMAACLAKGTTTITNAAREPEIADLIYFLRKMGAKISGVNSDTITIKGVKFLHGAKYSVSTDRIEAGTYLVAAAMTGGSITINDIDPASIESILSKLEESGAIIERLKNSIKLNMNGDKLKAASIKTATFPGFPTDMQAQFIALNSIAHGNSAVTETIFENRFMHVPELNRMGAGLTLKGNTVLCTGGKQLTGANVMATDLRASASLVLAGMVAKGKTVIERIYHLDRGYECIEEKLQRLGIDIQRVQS